MKNLNICLTLLLAVIVHSRSYSQAAGNFLYNNPQSFSADRAHVPLVSTNGSNVNLTAEVMMNVRATSYTVIFAAMQSGVDVVQVDSLMNQRINQIMYGLGVIGIPESDIHVDAVSMVPTYAFKIEEKKFTKRSTEIPTGFEMKKNIHVLFKHHEMLDRIISEMAFADIYDMVKVEYNLDGMQAYYETLRQEALKVIQSKESTYNALKLHLDIFSMTDGLNCTYPMERYKNYTAYNSGSSPYQVTYERSLRENYINVNGKNNTITLDNATADNFNQQFIVRTAEKNKTIFYDRMPYNQFDKVINADMEEPCIQLFYSLQVSYTMMTTEQYEKNKEQIELQKQRLLAPEPEKRGRRHRRPRYQ